MMENISLNRYLALDGMRGIAALVVMVFHYTHYFPNGPIAVDIFFCLSGFVIAHAYYQKLAQGMSFVDFMVRRMIRLYPMFLIGLFMGCLALLLSQAYEATDISAVMLHKILLRGLFFVPYLDSQYITILGIPYTQRVFPFNPPMWSLFFELFSNIAFVGIVPVCGILAPWVRRDVFKVFLFLLALMLLLGTMLYGPTSGYVVENFWGGLPRVLWAFFVGVGIFFLRRFRMPKLSPLIVMVFVLVMAALPSYGGIVWLGSALFLVPLLIMLGASVDMVAHAKYQPLCLYLGRISYPLYCLHYPVLIGISSVVGGGQNYAPVLLLLGMGFSIFLSHVALCYVDEPVRRWLALRVLPKIQTRT